MLTEDSLVGFLEMLFQGFRRRPAEDMLQASEGSGIPKCDVGEVILWRPVVDLAASFLLHWWESFPHLEQHLAGVFDQRSQPFTS